MNIFISQLIDNLFTIVLDPIFPPPLLKKKKKFFQSENIFKQNKF